MCHILSSRYGALSGEQNYPETCADLLLEVG